MIDGRDYEYEADLEEEIQRLKGTINVLTDQVAVVKEQAGYLLGLLKRVLGKTEYSVPKSVEEAERYLLAIKGRRVPTPCRKRGV